jgi:hypothetical protein
MKTETKNVSFLTLSCRNTLCKLGHKQFGCTKAAYSVTQYATGVRTLTKPVYRDNDRGINCAPYYSHKHTTPIQHNSHKISLPRVSFDHMRYNQFQRKLAYFFELCVRACDRGSRCGLAAEYQRAWCHINILFLATPCHRRHGGDATYTGRTPFMANTKNTEHLSNGKIKPFFIRYTRNKQVKRSKKVAISTAFTPSTNPSLAGKYTGNKTCISFISPTSVPHIFHSDKHSAR